MASTGTRIGRVTRITVAGAIYVELADVAPGFEFGPCLDTVGDLTVGDRVVVTSLARDPDELVIIGTLNPDSVTTAELDAALATTAPLVHTHAAGDVNTGVLALARLPVAPSGNVNATQIVRADDARLNDARTPTAHQHDAADVATGTMALARLPVAPSGTSSSTLLVRADDERVARPYVENVAASGSSFAVVNDSTERRPTNLAAITFTARGTTAVYRLSYSLDAQTFTANGFVIARFYVDGVAVAVPAGVLQAPGSTVRAPITKALRLTGLSAGSHTVEVRVTTQSTGTATIFEHSSIALELVS